MEQTFNPGDRVRLAKTRTFWTVPPGSNSTPTLTPSRTPRVGTEGTVVHMSDQRDNLRDNVVVNFDGNALHMLVSADCLELVAAPLTPGDQVKVVMPRRWYDTNGEVVHDSMADAYVGKIGTVTQDSILTQHGNVAVRFDSDDKILVGFHPSCLEKVLRAGVDPARSHLLGEDGTTVLGLDDAKQGVYQPPETPQDSYPVPLPPAVLEVTRMHEDEAGVVVTWANTDAIVEAKRQAAMAEELREQAVNELAGLKKQVVEVARRYAKQHDWCETVEDALSEMGVIEPRKRKIRFRMNLELTVEAEIADLARRDTVGDEWISDSFSFTNSRELCAEVEKAMDRDWTNVHATYQNTSAFWDGTWLDGTEG